MRTSSSILISGMKYEIRYFTVLLVSFATLEKFDQIFNFPRIVSAINLYIWFTDTILK